MKSQDAVAQEPLAAQANTQYAAYWRSQE